MFKIPGGPIDWKAWEAEALRPKSRKQSPEQRERNRQAQLAAAQRRRNAAAALAQAQAELARLRPVHIAPTLRNYDRILGCMELGKWYSTRDIADLSGVNYQSVKAQAVRFWMDGDLDRAQNPAWKPPERQGARQEPKWLYSVRRRALAAHRLAVALG